MFVTATTAATTRTTRTGRVVTRRAMTGRVTADEVHTLLWQRDQDENLEKRMQ
jgi:hypothetical protein